MITIVQRVSRAEVHVEERLVSRIGPGLLALVAVVREDSEKDFKWTANKLTTLRIYKCEDRHFDLDVRQVGGQILLVSNFTVAGQTRQGRRPSFEAAAEAAQARELFQKLLDEVARLHPAVKCGAFGQDMQVSLTNDGPVTFILDSSSSRRD